MHIVCPHCTTSYAINLATLGDTGRTVRCSRCKEVWLARPEDAIEATAPTLAYQSAGAGVAADWGETGRQKAEQIPMVESPSISAEWPAEGTTGDWPAVAEADAAGHAEVQARAGTGRRYRLPRIPFMPVIGALPTACGAMGALIIALLVWRNDVVRLLPQTALFYRVVGLDVNLRGLAFKDLKVTNETVDGKPVLVIEGIIVGQTRRPVELPRLRFSIRDTQGAEIYAWNAVLDQPVLNPGEHAFFKSRLASPPPEGRNIDVRFFNRRDLVGGRA